jgi:uncharacterized membrane protein
MNIKTLAINGIVAALYIAVSFAIQPFGFTAIQFRVSEMFNHLIVFNKKYIYGIILGVFLTNLFFSPMVAYDLVFGVGQLKAFGHECFLTQSCLPLPCLSLLSS